jgi:hypothetical protein
LGSALLQDCLVNSASGFLGSFRIYLKPCVPVDRWEVVTDVKQSTRNNTCTETTDGMNKRANRAARHSPLTTILTNTFPL